MENKLHYNATGSQLFGVLKTLMAAMKIDVISRGGRKKDFWDFTPICLKGKYWEIIKLDMIDFASS